VCDLETLKMRRPWPALGRSATENKQTNKHKFATEFVRANPKIPSLQFPSSPFH